VQQGPQAQVDLLELLDHKDHKDPKEPQAREQLEQPVHKEQPAHKGHKALPVQVLQLSVVFLMLMPHIQPVALMIQMAS
jgi:hypothetical protein